MRVAITGGTGILGGSIISFCESKGISFISFTRNEFGFPGLKDVINDKLLKFNADILIHCAASTNLELCETKYTDCYKVNYHLTEILVTICNKLNIKFIFISSTGIYGTEKVEPYTEFDNVSPTTVHHRSKWLAEKSVRIKTLDYLIIRTGWLFGGDWDKNKNFVANRIREANSSNGTINSDISQFGSPTYVFDLANCIFVMIDNNLKGTFNCVNTGGVSRYVYTKTILKISGIRVKVNPVKSSFFNRVAKVPNNEMAVNWKLNNIDLDCMPCWQSSLKVYIGKLTKYFNNSKYYCNY